MPAIKPVLPPNLERKDGTIDSAKCLWIDARKMFLNEMKQHYLNGPASNQNVGPNR